MKFYFYLVLNIFIFLYPSNVFALFNKVLLIPLDSRPVSVQFPKSVAAMGKFNAETPPIEFSGCFLDPGNPDKILSWMKIQDLGQYDAVVVSLDMIFYGGLVASRELNTELMQADARLQGLFKIRALFPNVKFYGFSAIARLAPTPTPENTGWDYALAQYLSRENEWVVTKNKKLLPILKQLKTKIPKGEIEHALAIRKRNHLMQIQLIQKTKEGLLDYLVLGQDDANIYGPQVEEAKELIQLSKHLGIEEKVHYGQGIDQYGMVLVSRAILRALNYSPKVKVVYSDDKSAQEVAQYESKPIYRSLEDQVLAGGAIKTTSIWENYDYMVFVNTPKPRSVQYKLFTDHIQFANSLNLPVALADIDLSDQRGQTGNPELFDWLCETQQMMKMMLYASWNTASNTLGTVIPAASVYSFYPTRHQPMVAHDAFMLDRLTDDHAYHLYVRPLAKKKAVEIGADPRWLNQEQNQVVQKFVQENLKPYLMKYFDAQVKDHPYLRGWDQCEITTIKDISITLPWSRIFEVQIDFDLVKKKIEKPSLFNQGR